MDRALQTSLSIPDDFPYFPLFGPSFLIDVPKGREQDENRESDLSQITDILWQISVKLKSNQLVTNQSESIEV